MNILVTGASGYIGSWITKTLCEAGHTVHATVRDLSRHDKVDHLESLADSTTGQIRIFEADLLIDGSFDQATQGCDAVVHSASPFIIGKYKSVQKQLIQPALHGTRNVLQSASKNGSVKKVVVTSSMAAMYGDNQDIKTYLDGQVSERTWNETSSAKHNPYAYSKTIAEKEAWKLANGSAWELAIINPGFVLGPSLSKRTDGTSVEVMLSLMNGRFKSGVPDVQFGLVDVRDVAQAHRLAIEKPVSGRFLTAAETGGFLDIARHIDAAYSGTYALPQKTLSKPLMYLVGPALGFSWKYTSANFGYPMRMDNRRIQEELGVRFRPMSESIRDHVTQIENHKLLT